MSAAIPPVKPGEKGLAANATTYDRLLGNTYTVNGVIYKWMKTSGVFTTCSSKCVRAIWPRRRSMAASVSTRPRCAPAITRPTAGAKTHWF